MKNLSSRQTIYSSTPLSKEWQFLIAAAKLEPTPDCQYILDGLTHSGLDWDRVIDIACQQGVASLVYHTIHRVNAMQSEHAALGRLKDLYCATAIRNGLLFEDLEIVLAGIEARGKPVIVLKGAALAEIVYRDRTLRPMSDVDLLIHKEDVAEAEQLLEHLGFVLDEMQQKSKEWHYTHRNQLSFRRQRTSCFTTCIEIHWQIERPTRPFPIDTEGLWNRAIPAMIANRRVLVLSPDDLILHLCLHACKHQLEAALRAFCDIVESVREFGEDMDWEQICKRAFEWRINTFVYVALRLTQEFLGVAVPEPIWDILAGPDFDTRVLTAARAAVLEHRLSATLFPEFFRLQHGNGVIDRVEVLKKIFSPAVVAQRYQLSPMSKKVYCYYPVRMTHLLVRYGPELLRFALSGHKVVIRAEHKRRLANWLAPFTDNCG